MTSSHRTRIMNVSLEEIFTMATAQFRIESRDPLRGSLLPPASLQQLYTNQSLAVAVAVKSLTDPTRQDIRVVHIPSGEVVFQTSQH
ncbi:hypothetical protein [Polaromonas sp.]|uniref:hypothetical protein n=1 Tax=Polaromonas sp. TaxID=1869339 RepID=UPI0032633D14